MILYDIIWYYMILYDIIWYCIIYAQLYTWKTGTVWVIFRFRLDSARLWWRTKPFQDYTRRTCETRPENSWSGEIEHESSKIPWSNLKPTEKLSGLSGLNNFALFCYLCFHPTSKKDRLKMIAVSLVILNGPASWKKYSVQYISTTRRSTTAHDFWAS